MSRNDISRDDLNRVLRSMPASGRSDQRATAHAIDALLSADLDAEARTSAFVGRRRFLQIGGLGITTAALLAACAGAEPAGVGRVGIAPTTTKLPDAKVDDIVLLRTASSLEHSVIALYGMVIDNADLLDPSLVEVAKRFRDDHMAHAATFESLTTEAGGTAWTCPNPRIDEIVLPMILTAITGGTTAAGVVLTKSDDAKRDVLNTAQALESLAGATYQGLMPVLSLPSLRKEAITIASTEVRHAAILSMVITGRPTGYADPDQITAATGKAPAAPAVTATTSAGPPPTPIPAVYAINGQY
ncbi:MAG: ferritin-like domain-containing protein, partial [Actinomycetota bacterium]